MIPKKPWLIGIYQGDNDTVNKIAMSFIREGLNPVALSIHGTPIAVVGINQKGAYAKIVFLIKKKEKIRPLVFRYIQEVLNVQTWIETSGEVVA